MPTSRGSFAIRSVLPKLFRYVTVSLIGTATTVVLIAALVGWANLTPVIGNLGAAGFSIALTFELDMRWVWRRRGRPSLTRQILPFWAWSLAELGLATVAVHLVADHGHAVAWSHAAVTEAVEVTSIGISLVTWLVQYAVFDRLLFVDNNTASRVADISDVSDASNISDDSNISDASVVAETRAVRPSRARITSG
jgi:putative flippase GtrA